MAKQKRELLKFREGDVGMKIRKDGHLEIAGVKESGMIDEKGMVNPILLFASAWARRDPKLFQVLIDNFKESVREGYFGLDAKRDYEQAMKLQEEQPNIAVKVPDKIEEPVLNPDSKPTVSTSSLGNEFETHSDVASGAVTFEQPAPLTDGGCGNADSDSGAVTFEQPKPYDMNGMLKGRDS